MFANLKWQCGIVLHSNLFPNQKRTKCCNTNGSNSMFIRKVFSLYNTAPKLRYSVSTCTFTACMLSLKPKEKTSEPNPFQMFE